ncbi:MAG: TIM barrel protein [Bacteroidales bacterium]|nr:TIM barrel protein [Bacteroidales bacterium]
MKKSILSIALIIFSIIALTSCDQANPEKFIGLQLYSLRGEMKERPAETVKLVGEMGYGFVEAAGYKDGKFYGMEPLDFKQVVEESGMVFLGSHTGQNIPDSTNWDKTMEWWDQCIAAHKEAGVEYIVKPSMGKKAYASLEGLKDYCEYFDAVGEKCNEAGIRFGYHNHAKEFSELEGEVIYDFMLNNTDPEKVMFQIDLYWAIEGGVDPNVYFENFPGRFWLWHVKDEKEVGASGNIDFEKIWTGTEKAGVKYFIVEQEEYYYLPLESIEMSLKFLLDADYVK